MKVLKDLLLACLNATLILVALCLFLLWQLSGTVERISGEFAKNLDVLSPVGARIESLTQEVAALRADLANASTSEAIRARVSQLEAEAKRLNDTLTKISETPERLMEKSITTTAQSATASLLELRECKAPEAEG